MHTTVLVDAGNGKTRGYVIDSPTIVDNKLMAGWVVNGAWDWEKHGTVGATVVAHERAYGHYNDAIDTLERKYHAQDQS